MNRKYTTELVVGVICEQFIPSAPCRRRVRLRPALSIIIEELGAVELLGRLLPA